MRTAVYAAKCSYRVNRFGAPPDMATFETEFVLDDKSIHPNDDPDVLALSSAYQWAKLVRSDLTNECTRVEPLYFQLRVGRQFIIAWNSNQRDTLEKLVKLAVEGQLPQQVVKAAKKVATTQS